MNFMRFTLPLLIAREDLSLANVLESPWALFWAVDILQMPGLSFIVLKLMKAYLPLRWAC